jgi:flagellin
MTLVVNSNIASITAATHVASTRRDMEISMERLASGKRINGAADDAAGVAIVARMDSQIRAMEMSIKNVNDGISLAQTMEGALIEIEAMTIRIRDLAIQGSNETNSDADQLYLNEEIQALADEITRIITDTTFNGYTVYDNAGVGTVTNNQTAAAATTGFIVAVEAGSGVTSDINVTHTSLAAGTFVTAARGFDDPTASAAGITTTDTFLDKIATARSELGALMNRFEHLSNSMSETIVNTEAAKGRILDTDFASETANLSKTQILQQAGTAMLAQANAAPQSVLALLQ